MNKIKVLFFTGTMGIGGIENQLMHLLRNADKDKFQFDFTSTEPADYYREEIEMLGGKYIQIPSMSHTNPFPYCKAIYRIMKGGEYDIIHSHELFHSGIVLLVAKLAGVPGRFVHAHNWQDGDGSEKKRGVIRTIYNAVMRGLILSCSTQQLACSTLAGKFLYGEKCIQRDSYHLVFNSVDTGKFLDHYDDPESGEFCDGWINVLQVGRVTMVKNQMFLVEIADEFKRRKKKIRILCAGNGDADYTEMVNCAIRDRDLGDYIQMLGARGDIDVLMRKACAFVLPSKYEGMPLVLIEAQASGLPCVSADTFSREVDFEIGKVQWLCLEDGIAVWADAIEHALTTGRAEKSQIAHVIQEKQFDSRMFAKTLCKLYEKSCLMNGVSRRSASECYHNTTSMLSHNASTFYEQIHECANAKEQCKAVVSLSFDDGRGDNTAVVDDLLLPRNIPVTLNITTGYIDGTCSPALRPSSKQPMRKEDVIRLGKHPLVEIALHGDQHLNTPDDILLCRKKLIDWLDLDENHMFGFASPGSALSIETWNSEEFSKLRTSLLYMRDSLRINSHRFARTLSRRMGRVIHIPILYKIAYEESEMRFRDHKIIYSACVHKETTFEQVRALLDDCIKHNASITLMFHSILEDCKHEDAWSWDKEKFIKLCEYLVNKRAMGKLEISTTKALYEMLQ